MKAEWTIDEAGWVSGVKQRPSPHCDPRPAGAVAELAVIHNISLPPGQFGGGFVEALFAGRLDPTLHPYFEPIAGLRVSAHFLVARDGVVTQFVSCESRAWHAGVSNYRGREKCNDFSIGIELEGTDDSAYEPAQYRALSAAILQLCAAYRSLSIEHITGHSDIAPGRKTDPGDAFDWPRSRALLQFQARTSSR